MRVVFQKPDLDTCLAALVLGVRPEDEVVVVRGRASDADLLNPAVVCLEAGGAGQTSEGNFDHHGEGAPLEPACVQALAAADRPSDVLRRLVEYAAAVDTSAYPSKPPLVTDDVLTLSSAFSGMRLVTPDAREQFVSGLAMLREILRRDFNPFGPIPELPMWAPYFEAKRAEQAAVREALTRIERFTTVAGHSAGFLETGFKGALGAIYDLGCDVAIAFDAEFASPAGGTVRKYSIGGNHSLRVDGLLAMLTDREPGWGGPSHGTVLGSPHEGTRLEPAEVKELVRQYL